MSYNREREPLDLRQGLPPSRSSNVRSFAAFDDCAEEGAYIPDIAMRRTPSVTALESDLFRTQATPKHSTQQRVMTPSNVGPELAGQVSEAARPFSSASNPEPSHPFVTAAEDGLDKQAPSTAPRSFRSKSSRPRAYSDTSSVALPTTLPALQTKGAPDNDGLEPLAEEEIDPASFDLVVPAHNTKSQYSLETRSELLFSAEHLRVIVNDPILLQRFTNFLWAARSDSVPLLVHYLEAVKALKAIGYANSIAERLGPVEGLDASHDPVTRTVNDSLRTRADKALEALAREDLPAYITNTWIKTVSVTIKRRIADTLPAHLRDMSEGLAEVFCLTDPSRPDNPIVFASEEFHRTTQYGMNYVLGRNCRFLQGPKTNRDSTRRIRERLEAGKEHCETFLNYRRDGSPFMNLLMVAPLYDSRGKVRYHIGAQVDVSGLAKDNAGLESLERLVARKQQQQQYRSQQEHAEDDQLDRDSGISTSDHGGNVYGVTHEYDDGHSDSHHPGHNRFRSLAERFNLEELKDVRQHGGALHRTHQEELGDADQSLSNWNRPRVLIKDDATLDRRLSDPVSSTFENHLSSGSGATGGRLAGVYQHYLLVRPYPSLRVLFASPSLRTPGMLQSELMSRIGGSKSVKDAITDAMQQGCGVTAKVRWISSLTPGSANRPDGESPKAPEGRSRWIHCTPLLGGNGAVGVWMVVLVDDEAEVPTRRPRDAPPVSVHIGAARRNNNAASPFDQHHPYGSAPHGPPQSPRAPSEYQRSVMDGRMQQQHREGEVADDLGPGGYLHSAAATATPTSPSRDPNRGADPRHRALPPTPGKRGGRIGVEGMRIAPSSASWQGGAGSAGSPQPPPRVASAAAPADWGHSVNPGRGRGRPRPSTRETSDSVKTRDTVALDT